MDKRFLASGRDIRGRKRAILSDESNGSAIKNYSQITIHDLFSKFIDLKRSEGISKSGKRTCLKIRSISQTFSNQKVIRNLWTI